MDSPNLIAIVGRPNVGKSALFNRIARRRIAIVHDEPGVTRDRISVEAEWNGRPFTLVDTGGLGLLRGEKARDVIVQAAFEQVELAIEAATVIILVVNLQEGVVPLDREVAQRLRKAGKPVLVAINKADNDQSEAVADVFTELGFAQNFPVSAIHQRGISALMDAAVALLPKETAPPARKPRRAAPPPRPQAGHHWPAQRRQVLHHQRPDPIQARHRHPHPRHDPRRGGRALHGRDGRRAPGLYSY